MNAQSASTTRSQHLVPRVAEAHSRLSRNYPGLLASLGFVALLLVSVPALAQLLGNAQSFAILGGSAVNANGSGSSVNGDVGINPAAATFITGFPANATIVLPFSNHGNDSTAINASGSAVTLYNSAVMAPAGATNTLGNDLSISGPTSNGHYTPGRYTNTAGGVALIPVSASITLDGAGIYVFTVANALTANGNVILNGVDPCTVFWRVPTTATLNGIFKGTVVSDALIALGSGATVTGRALTTTNGSVTLAGGNTIGGCSGAPITITPATLPPGTVGVPYSQPITPSGGTAPITFTVVGGTLPAGLTLTAGGVLSGTPTTPGCVTVTIRATDVNGRITDTTFTFCIVSVSVSGGGTAIPTLSEWAMGMLAALLAIAGFAAMRRRAR
jgi:Ice-binding-like/Putative Ig domain/IPTL-CTERM motif